MGIDLMINQAMKLIEVEWLVLFFEFISPIMEPEIILIFAFILAGLIYFKKSKKEGIFFASVMFISALFVLGSKYIFNRARPLDALLIETTPAFPSGHATIAVVFLSTLFFLFIKNKNWKSGLGLGLILLFIGFNRLYLRVHWFTDILGGYLLGTIIFLGTLFIFRKFNLLES